MCTIDCLEHMFVCPAVLTALGPPFSAVSIAPFFPVGQPRWFQLGMVCILYSLYTWRNTLRHSDRAKFGSKGLWRLAYDLAFQFKFKDMHLFQSRGSNYLTN